MKDSLHYRLRACHLSCQKMIVQDLKNETDLKPGEPKILEFLADMSHANKRRSRTDVIWIPPP